MKWIKSGLLALTLALAGGCAALTGTTSLTPNEQEAAAITAVTTARQTGDTLVKAGKVTKTEAQAINNQCDAVLALVTAARALPPGSSGVAADLAQAASLLTSLQSFLVTKGG